MGAGSVVNVDDRSGPAGAGHFLSQDFFPLGFLQFSEFESWNEVANWATKLFEAKAPRAMNCGRSLRRSAP
jgi:hypothetical protein